MKTFHRVFLLRGFIGSILLATGSYSAIKVGFAPTMGKTSHPLIIEGVKQMVMNDLELTGEYQVVQDTSALINFNATDVKSAATMVDIILQLHVRDNLDQVEITLRAHDTTSGYSLGSQTVRGQLQNVQLIQDKMSSAVLSVVRASVPPQKKAEIYKQHIQNASSLHYLGQAQASLDKKDMASALNAMSQAKLISPDAKGLGRQVESLGGQYLLQAKAADDKGMAYLYMGNPASAIKEFEAALQTNPGNQKAILGKAEALMMLGQYSAALPLLQQAQTQDPRNPKIAQLMGDAYAALGKGGVSLDQYKKAADLGSENPRVYQVVASDYVQKRQLDSASKAFARAGDLSRASVNLREAQAMYSKANQVMPTTLSIDREIDVLIQMGQYDVALAVLNKAVVQKPDSDHFRAKLGYVYYVFNQPDNAFRRFKEAYELNPRNFEANYYLGLLYDSHFKDLNLSLKYLEAAHKVKPEEMAPALKLAEIYLRENRQANAVTLLEGLLKIHPNNIDLKLKLADAYYENGGLTEAEALFSKVLDLIPDNLEASEGLAKIYAKQGNVSKTLAALEKVFAIDATNNYFVRIGANLLEKLTSKKLIELLERFPKEVPGGSGTVSINQVSLLRLQTNSRLIDKLKNYFSIYVVNESRLRRDLEIALYSKYRVISASKQKFIEPSEFKNKASLDALAGVDHVEGVFVYDVLKFLRGPNTDQITLDLYLHSVPDGGLHGIEDKSTIEAAVYPKNQIIVLNPQAPLAYLLVFFLTIFPVGYFTIYRARKRGWGKVKVTINYDPKLESYLTLKLSTKEEEVKTTDQLIVRDKDKYQKAKYKELLRQRGTWVKQMVGRVTIFENVPARTYYCYLYGTIEDTGFSKKSIGNYSMSQKFTLKKNETTELVFELEKKDAYVTVFVMKGDEFIAGAQIKCTGSPEAKFARGEAGTFFYLPVGEHVVTVTHEGKQYRQKLRIKDLTDVSMHIDIQNVDELLDEPVVSEEKVVKAAESMQKQGRMTEAAKLYEKAGKKEEAVTSRAEQYLSEGNTEKAAEEYAKAKDFIKAAAMYKQMNDPKKAATMYGFHYISLKDYPQAIKHLENTDSYQILASAYKAMDREDAYHSTMAKHYLQKNQKIEAAHSFVKAKEYSAAAEIFEGLGDFSKAAVLYARDSNYSLAANLYAQAGENEKAALAYDQGGFYDEAIHLYRELDHKEKIIEILIRIERYTEAAREAKSQGLNDEAIKVCQKVVESHPDYVSSRILLADLFYERGETDLALNEYQHLMKEHAEHLDDQALYNYADILEKTESYDSALAIFEQILKKNFHYKDVNMRVSELKPKAAKLQQKKGMASQSYETVAGATPKEMRYEMLGELGRGAMGVVFKARDKTLNRIVAYKTLPHTLKNDESAMESLMQEAQTAAKLNHPNIVTIFDVGEENDTYFMAMEYVEGQTLQDVLKKYKRITGDNFLHIAKSLCSCMSYAHEQKIIHRDIKPSNIILMPNKNVKLMDFGLARIMQDLAIDKTMLRGTPLYMAPEQVLGKDIDHRCDIYSLGIVLYEMLCGTPPFTEGDIMYAHLHTPPEPLSDRAPNLPKHLCDAVMMCLKKDKTQRPASTKQLWTLLAAR